MTAVADWHGRVTLPDLNLRGDISQACDRLENALDAFDYRKAAKPPYKVPSWAVSLLEENNIEAMQTYLVEVHPRDGQKPKTKHSFRKFIRVYHSLDIQGDLIRFCKNYFASCEKRTPSYGSDYPGYLEEVGLIEEMSHAYNDHIKFEAISAFGRFAPLTNIAFLEKRTEKKYENCQNPNIILCRSVQAIGDMVGRYSLPEHSLSKKDRKSILKTLPWLTRVLDEEGRNNSACTYVAESIKEIIAATGDPEALEAFLHNFKAPECNSQWMIDYTDRYHDRILPWLKECTGQDFGKDFDAWKRWFDKNETKLDYDPDKKAFIINRSRAP